MEQRCYPRPFFFAVIGVIYVFCFVLFCFHCAAEDDFKIKPQSEYVAISF